MWKLSYTQWSSHYVMTPRVVFCFVCLFFSIRLHKGKVPTNLNFTYLIVRNIDKKSKVNTKNFEDVHEFCLRLLEQRSSITLCDSALCSVRDKSLERLHINLELFQEHDKR